ncbi:MAG: hypothetical protein ACOY0T_38630 [Myxococcota bacterium]
MRNSYIDIRRNGPDTSELDAGWDCEPNEQRTVVDPSDSLRPSHTSLRPTPAPLLARDFTPARVKPARFLPALAFIVVGAAAGAVVAFGRMHRAAPAQAVAAQAPDTLEAAAVEPAARLNQPGATVAQSAPLLAESPAPVVQPAADVPVVQPASTARRVLLEIEPPGATVFVRGQRLGNDLVNVELGAQHERATITLAGYRTRVVDLDGSAEFVHVTLEPLPRARTRAERASRPAPVPTEEAEATSEDRLAPALSAKPAPTAETSASPAASPAEPAQRSEADVAYPE